MKPKHLLFSLLLALLAVWQYQFFVWAREIATPNVYSAVSLGISLSQLTLAAIWVGMGVEGLTVRFTTLTAAVWLSAFLNSHVWKATLSEWIGIFLLIAGMVVVPLLVIRSSIGPLGKGKPDHRFSLGFLISLMTVCSLAMATVRIGSLPWDHVVAVASSCLIFAGTALATTWCLSGGIRYRILALPPLFFGAAWSLATINLLPLAIFFVIVTVQGGVVAVALEILRIGVAAEQLQGQQTTEAAEFETSFSS